MLRCLALFALLWVAHASNEPGGGLRAVDTPTENTTSTDSGSKSGPVDRARFFFGAYSTLSHTLVSFTTSTVYSSCFQGFSTAGSPGTRTQCSGRRKRRDSALKTLQIKRTSEDDDLSSSHVEKLANIQPEEDANLGRAKKFFTVWTKSITITTLTSYFTDTATTISLTYYCSAGSLDIPYIGC